MTVRLQCGASCNRDPLSVAALRINSCHSHQRCVLGWKVRQETSSVSPSTSSPARNGVFLCRGARHKHGGAWLASHVDMRAGALGLYAASRCLRRRKAGIVSGSSRWRTDRRRAVAIATLPARHAILDVIGCFLTNRCQIEKLLFYGYVFGRFGKLPIFGCFVPKIISPIHVASRLQQLPEGAGGHSTTG